MCDGRLAKTNADLVKIFQIRIAQIGITLPNVVDGLVHPVLLIFDFRPKNSTAMHMTEQLVTGSIKQLLVGQITLHSSYWHKHAFSAPGRDLSFSGIT